MAENTGALLVCFDRESGGEKYARQCVAATGSIRAVAPALPIVVVTNLPRKTPALAAMADLYGVQFRYVDAGDSENRAYKTDMFGLSRWKFTAYIDCDALVMRKDWLAGFDMVRERDVALAAHHQEEMLPDTTRPGQVAWLEKLTGTSEIIYWCSGTIFFARTAQAQEFFGRWHSMYRTGTTGPNDMLALNVAVNKTPNLRLAPLGWTWSCQDAHEGRAVVLHRGSQYGTPLPHALSYLAEAGLVEAPLPGLVEFSDLRRQPEPRTLLAGPYFGELGHEVALWAPHVKWFAEHMAATDVVVGCQPGHEALYPFATSFVNIRYEAAKEFADGLWMAQPSGEAMQEFSDALRACREREPFTYWLRSDRRVHRATFDGQRAPYAPVPPHTLSPLAPNEPFAVMAYRGLRRGEPKNTTNETFDRVHTALARAGLRLVLVGVDELAGGEELPDDVIDLVNQTTLADVIALFAHAQVVIGESTGTLHLASYCGTQHIVWGGGSQADECKKRYLDTWNPNRTWCRWLGNELPTATVLYNAVIAAQEAR